MYIYQTDTASTFAAEFMALCKILYIDLNTWMGDFHLKVKCNVRKALVMLSTSTTFDELVEHAVHLNHAQYILYKSSENQNYSNLFCQRKPSNLTFSQSKNPFSSFQLSQLHQAPYMHPFPTSSSQRLYLSISQKECNGHKQQWAPSRSLPELETYLTCL